MSGGAVLKVLPTATKKEVPSTDSIDIFDIQQDNMPCKECKQGAKDCVCDKPEKPSYSEASKAEKRK